MEEKVIKIAAGIMGIMSMVIVCALFYFPTLHIWAEETAQLDAQQKAEQQDKMNGLQMLQYNTANVEQETEIAFTQQLRIEVPQGSSVDKVKVTDDYLTQTITIEIPDADENYLYDYPMVGKSTNIDNLTYESQEQDGIIEITMDKVVEVETTKDEQYVYLDFLTPHEVYDKVIVVDAGHGSKDPGASKQGISEKDIDLAILLELKKLFDAESDGTIGVYYTRTEDANPSLSQRVELANKAEADLFVSIHNNSTKSGRMSSINGTAVMYDEAKATEEKGSMQFANICLEELLASLGSNSKGLVAGNDIYIIRSAEMPVALVEVGFMTNQDELDSLKDAQYQQKAAEGIYRALHRALEEGY